MLPWICSSGTEANPEKDTVLLTNVVSVCRVLKPRCCAAIRCSRAVALLTTPNDGDWAARVRLAPPYNTLPYVSASIGIVHFLRLRRSAALRSSQIMPYIRSPGIWLLDCMIEDDERAWSHAFQEPDKEDLDLYGSSACLTTYLKQIR